MIKYMLALISCVFLSLSPCLAGIGIGVTPYPGPGVVVTNGGGGGETIGTSIQGASQLANATSITYFYPVSGQFATGGNLASYKVTMRAQSGSRTINLALFTYNGSTTMTKITGSDTGSITYTAAVDKTDVTLSPTSAPSVSSETTYYVGVKLCGFAAIYGTTGTGSAFYSTGSCDAAFLSTYSAITATTGVPGKMELTR